MCKATVSDTWYIWSNHWEHYKTSPDIGISLWVGCINLCVQTHLTEVHLLINRAIKEYVFKAQIIKCRSRDSICHTDSYQITSSDVTCRCDSYDNIHQKLNGSHISSLSESVVHKQMIHTSTHSSKPLFFWMCFFRFCSFPIGLGNMFEKIIVIKCFRFSWYR